MRLCHLVFTGLLFVISNALAQDDLIDDLSKERKEAAAKEAAPRRSQPKSRAAGAPGARPDKSDLQPVPNTDLIDDLSPEQKRAAAERDAARKIENAIPDNLADALARALRHCPTILVAEAKVRQAQAELNEVRLSVTQELTLAFRRRASNKQALAFHEAAEAIGKEQPVANTKLRQAIMEDESRIVYLLGVGLETADHADRPDSSFKAMAEMMSGMRSGTGGATPGGSMAGGAVPGGMMGMQGMQSSMMRMMGGDMPGGMMGGLFAGGAAASADRKSESALSEKLRKFLQTRIEMDFTEQPVSDVLDYLHATAGGDVNFVWKKQPVEGITMSLKQVTVEAGLQAIADLTDYCFIFRDYGILVLSHTDGNSYRQTGIPMIDRGMPAQQSKP